MEPLNVVYMLHLGDGVARYVGLTTVGVTERLRSHRKNARQNRLDWPVYRWMRKHGPEAVVAELLESVGTRQELDACEAKWIAALKSAGFDLLNCTAGGGGMRVVSPKVRAKLGPKRGSKLSPEHLAQIRGENHHFYGRKHTAETKAKMSANNGMKRPEVADKIRQAKLGTRHSEETRRRISESKRLRPSPANHLRWHVERDVWADACSFCEFEVAA